MAMAGLLMSWPRSSGGRLLLGSGKGVLGNGIAMVTWGICIQFAADLRFVIVRV